MCVVCCVLCAVCVFIIEVQQSHARILAIHGQAQPHTPTDTDTDTDTTTSAVTSAPITSCGLPLLYLFRYADLQTWYASCHAWRDLLSHIRTWNTYVQRWNSMHT